MVARPGVAGELIFRKGVGIPTLEDDVKKILVLVAVVAFIPGPIHAADRAEVVPLSVEEMLAGELVDLTGGASLGKQVAVQMIEALKPMFADVPEAFWREFLESFDSSELRDMIVAIYVRHLTAPEMQAAVDFYSTSEGKSLVEKLPVIVQESMEVGQRWGEEVAAEVVQRLESQRERPDA